MHGSQALRIAGISILLNGCSAAHCGTCIGDGFATLRLSCNPNDLKSVMVDGPCSRPDAGLSAYTGRATKWFVGVSSPIPGTCRIQLEFASGFTYSATATFGWMKDNDCGSCPDYIGATNGPFIVNNPPETCSATGGDSGMSMGAP
jgi:hypothetical protein